jgi:hypothetical protein
MRSAIGQGWPVAGLALAAVLLGFVGGARGDGVVGSDVQGAMGMVAPAGVGHPDYSIAQVEPKRPAVVREPAGGPRPPLVPRLQTPPQRPPAPRIPETPPSPAEDQPPSNLLASLFGANAPPAERLAGTPNMFGDFFNNVGGGLLATDTLGGSFAGYADLPLAAGCRRVKIAENDSAVPQDRIFYMYNHFQDSLQADVVPSPIYSPRTERSLSVDRYTFGFEKTFFDGNWSAEMRMPIAGTTNFETPVINPGMGVEGGCVGNLAVIVKRSIYRSCSTAVAVGMGVDTPTGSDVDGFVSITPTPTFTYFTMHNDAVHLLPFVGFVHAPTDEFFWQGFLQVDVPLNGNRIDYEGVRSQVVRSSGELGTLNEQSLMYLDLSGGYWVYRNQCSPGLTGLATLVEVHYTTTMQDTDVVQGTVVPAQLQLTYANFANRVDVLDFTVGLHAEFANHTLCRVGGVFPLSTGDDRAFNSEIQVQVERRF